MSSKAAFSNVLGTSVTRRILFKVFKEDYRLVNATSLGLYPPLSSELAMWCRIKAAVTRPNKVRTSCNLYMLLVN